MDILVTVEGQKMKLAACQSHCIAGSKSFVKFRFTLSEEWKNLAVCAVFEQGGKKVYQALSDGCAYLPNEITKGICNMGLLGFGGTITATTNLVRLIIEDDSTITT